MKRFQLFSRGISANWTGTVGVALATSSFLLLLLFELLQLAGILDNSFIGLVAYMALPALFILGWLLILLGWWQYRRATGRSTEELLPERFPEDMVRARRLGSSVLATMAVVVVVSVVFIGVEGARMLHFMDTPKFCGTACHKIMEPEWTAYQNSPHAHVHCVECHVGEGVGALVNAKINGLWQVISGTFNLYERPVPTPVHQLRPARETCEKCHWPDKFYGDRIKSFAHFAMDEESTPLYSTLSLKIGGGTGDSAGTIHWHVAGQNEVRYLAADEKRLVMEWVEVRRGDTFHRFTNRALEPSALEHPLPEGQAEARSMDCVDCHNRATHIYADPEEAVNQALASGFIDRGLPFAKRTALAALMGEYPDKDAARKGIERSIRGFYQRDLDRTDLVTSPAVGRMVAAVQDIYDRNIFPFMNVGWNPYPVHLGHKGEGGCFRCHNKDMVDENGQSIGYDCTLCHSILAQDSRNEFQFLMPLAEDDPDRQMHRYLQEEFLGVPVVDPFAPPEDSTDEGATP